jgi:hypothetical protein
MDTLCLQPAFEWPRAAEHAEPIFLSAERCLGASLDAWLATSGQLEVTPAGEVPPGDENRLLFTLRCVDSLPPGQAAQREWLLLRRDRAVQVNGIAVLPVTILEPGSLISAGKKRWLVASIWTPTPRPAPGAVKDVDCPVCGAPLSVAPVVQCPCGRYMHFERPDQPEDAQALNCYVLAGSCGICGRTSSLTPSLLPAPDETLVAEEDLERTLALAGAK